MTKKEDKKPSVTEVEKGQRLEEIPPPNLSSMVLTGEPLELVPEKSRESGRDNNGWRSTEFWLRVVAGMAAVSVFLYITYNDLDWGKQNYVLLLGVLGFGAKQYADERVEVRNGYLKKKAD
jgi:hypothetical protein